MIYFALVDCSSFNMLKIYFWADWLFLLFFFCLFFLFVVVVVVEYATEPEQRKTPVAMNTTQERNKRKERNA